MIKETLTTIFSTRLNEALAKRPDLNQREISRRLDRKPQVVNTWFTGKAFPGLETVDHLAEIFEIDPSYFFGGAPERERVGVREALNIIMDANGLMPVREKGPDLSKVPSNILKALSQIEDFNSVEIAVLKQLAKEERESRYSV